MFSGQNWNCLDMTYPLGLMSSIVDGGGSVKVWRHGLGKWGGLQHYCFLYDS